LNKFNSIEKFCIASLQLSLMIIIGVISGVCNANCLVSIAKKYQLSPQLLISIAITESGGNPEAIGPMNSNGTIDLGIMQINSAWLPKLKKYGIQRLDLFKPCVNIEVAAWVLSQNILTYGNTWRAVGAYNSSKPLYQSIYANKVSIVFAQVSDMNTLSISRRINLSSTLYDAQNRSVK